MAREIQYLYLHLAQLKLSGENAMGKAYHTPKVNEFIKENNRLLDYVMSTYNEPTLQYHINLFYELLSFVNDCHAFIVTSTTDDVRSEIFTCLRFVLKEWIHDPEKYVIMCTHGNFGFKSYNWGKNDVYDFIESTFGFTYSMKMIPIYMPFHMKGDFLYNAALYHEIGHFVDRYHKITALIVEEVKNGTLIIPQQDVYLNDMTESLASNPAKYYEQLNAYIGEFLADLIAARYTCDSIFHFLSYINPTGKASIDHPSHAVRRKLIDEFLGEKRNYGDFLKMLLQYVKDRAPRELTPLKLNMDISSFVQLQDCNKPESPKHLHSIVPNLWEIWNNRRSEFKDASSNPMNFVDIYKSLMNLTANAVQKMQ